MQAKTVLVTGGAGFIGSFVCEQLLKEGHRVICLDNFLTGHVRNIEHLLSQPNFQFLKVDIAEPFDLTLFPELEPFKVRFLGVQEVYHLAMPTAAKNYEEFRKQAALTASVGTKNVLEMAVRFGSRVVLASSGTVYGDHASDALVAETDIGTFDHLNSRGGFNEGKRFSETLGQTYSEVHGLDVKIARIFRTYGPRMPLFHGHQIADFALNILDDRDVVIMGDEKSPTALTYVSDIVDGLMRLMSAEKGIGPVNLGSDTSVPIMEVAKMMMRLAEKETGVAYEAAPAHLVQLGLPSLEKAKERLGWLPLVRLEDGLQKTLDYVRANKMLLTEGASGR